MFLDHSMCTVLKKLNLTLGVIQKVRSLRRRGKGVGGGVGWGGGVIEKRTKTNRGSGVLDFLLEVL